MNESNEMNPVAIYSRNKVLSWAGIIYILLFIGFIVSKNLVKQGVNGWSDPPIYDNMIWFGMGGCISIIGVIYSYFAWTRNPLEFVEWLNKQSPIINKSQVDSLKKRSNYTIRIFRIIGPIAVVFGIAMVGRFSFLILSFLFKG